ncbi:MAG: glycosyltransferase [Candidatus Wallbacteria bacterium]|nr:glycosyltransferase [Candidatus Wallbacteria bacterium]
MTLAIPCYNGGETFPRVLEAVRRLEPAPMEVVVVDDGSTDGSAAVAEEQGLRVVRHGFNRGLGAARNSAVVASRGEIIVFLDADCLPEPGLLGDLLAGFDAPDVAGVGGRELGAGAQPTLYDVWRLAFRPQTHGPEPRPDVWMLPGLCCAYRRSALAAVGGFDAFYRTNGEDVDAGVRLRERGWKLRYRPGAGVTHVRRDGFRTLLGMCWRFGFWGAFALACNRHPALHLLRGQLRWTAVCAWSSWNRLGSSVLALASPCFGLAGLGGTVTGIVCGMIRGAMR